VAVSTDQYNAILSRLTKIERALNDVFTAQRRFITDAQMNEVFTVIQQEMDSLASDVEALEDRVTTLEEEPYDETE
jgi:polyhydroxyalkanoate synthesis regulator phasin